MYEKCFFARFLLSNFCWENKLSSKVFHSLGCCCCCCSIFVCFVVDCFISSTCFFLPYFTSCILFYILLMLYSLLNVYYTIINWTHAKAMKFIRNTCYSFHFSSLCTFMYRWIDSLGGSKQNKTWTYSLHNIKPTGSSRKIIDITTFNALAGFFHLFWFFLIIFIFFSLSSPFLRISLSSFIPQNETASTNTIYVQSV